MRSGENKLSFDKLLSDLLSVCILQSRGTGSKRQLGSGKLIPNTMKQLRVPYL